MLVAGLLLFVADVAYLCTLKVGASVSQCIAAAMWCLISTTLIFYGLRPKKSNDVYLVLAVILSAACIFAIVAYLIKNEIV